MLMSALGGRIDALANTATKLTNAAMDKRDGSTEFDTDLCILKKRGDVLGLGVDNCDL